MLTKLTQRLGPTARFVLALASILGLLLVTAGLWWWLPAWPRVVLRTARGACYEIQIAANGQTLVAANGDDLVVWDVARRQEVAVTPYREWGEDEIVVAPDGKALALVQKIPLSPTRVQLWHFATQPWRISVEPSDALGGFTADGRFAIVRQDTYKLYDPATTQEVPLPPPLTGGFEDIHPLPDGGLLLSAAYIDEGWLENEFSTYLWTVSPDLHSASQPLVLRGILGKVTFAPDGQKFAVCHMYADAARIELYELATGRMLAPVPIPRDAGVGIPYFSPDGKRLVTTSGQDHTIWDMTTMHPRRLHTISAASVHFSPDSRWVTVLHVTGTTRKSLEHKWEIRDAATGEKLGPTISLWNEPLVAPDGESIAYPMVADHSVVRKWLAGWVPGISGRASYTSMQFWHLPDWRPIANFADARCAAYFPNGHALGVGYEDGTIEIWDLPLRRPWWIEYGLPVIFAVLILLAGRIVWRAFRKPRSPEPAPC
jgi:WD40 repeat protein